MIFYLLFSEYWFNNMQKGWESVSSDKEHQDRWNTLQKNVFWTESTEIPTPVKGVKESCSQLKSKLAGECRAHWQLCTIPSPSVATHTGPILLKAAPYTVCPIQGSSVTPAGCGLGWITWWTLPTLSIAKAGWECPPEQCIFPFPFPGALSQRQQEQENSVSSSASQILICLQ